MFRTSIEKQSFNYKLNTKSKILSIGSCFSEEVGQKLRDAKTETSINPFGTVFNPISIFNILKELANPEGYYLNDFIQRDDTWFNHQFHSSFRSATKSELELKVGRKFEEQRQIICNADFLIVTFGSAWVYDRKDNQVTVSNCHKVPSKHFDKRLLQQDEIISAFFEMKEQIEEVNQNVKFILTVSPVRHTKDTLTLNSVSKSTLRTACHYLSEMDKETFYYPSYEILMDDLRDYRFYEADMIHPNSQAIDYIWKHFLNNCFDEKSAKIIQEWESLKKSLSHKAFNPKSEQHQKFLKSTLSKLEQMSKHLSLNEEVEMIKREISRST